MSDTNPFWQFSRALYAEPGVADACLELQDRYAMDVNLLLYCSWRAYNGIELDCEAVAAMDRRIADWRRDVVLPIRKLRRGLRQYPGVDSTRDHLKRAELEAECSQQEVMWGEGEVGEPGQPAPPALLRNLMALAQFMVISESALDTFRELCRTLFVQGWRLPTGE